MIAIVGAGIAGLAAAHELSSRGIPFRIFEASDRAGGLIRTEHVDGFTMEAGADSMLAQKPAAIDLCRELGLGPRLMSTKEPRGAFVLHRGVLVPLPTPAILGIPVTAAGLAGYSLLSPAARARVAMEPLLPRRTRIDDEPIGAFFRRRFGARTVDVIAQPLLGGIHAGDVDALSLQALLPRLAEAERTGSVLRWMRRSALASHGDGAFRSLPSGMGELVSAIVARLPPGSLELNTPVERLSTSATGWTVTTRHGDVSCAAVILACPAFVASQLLAPLDPDASSLCGAVKYVSTVSIAFAWRRAAVAHPLAGSGFVVARRTNDVRITACTWVSSKWHHRAPDGHVLLRAYLGGAHDSSVVERDDEALKGVAVRELSAILSISEPPEMTRINRWRRAGAQHEVGHLARVAALESRLALLPGLFITGSGFQSVGIPDCVADGRTVAAAAGVFAHAH